MSEHPAAGHGSYSRFGRKECFDTTAFLDIKHSDVADELAMKARAGEIEAVDRPIWHGRRPALCAPREFSSP